MPELPEVTGFKRYLDSFGLHQRIRKTSVLDGRILDGLSARQLQARLRGVELECTTRHGKYVFARVSRGGWLVLHFGMSGHLRYYGRDADGPPRFARVVWSFDNGSHLAYLSPRMLGWVGFTADWSQVLAGRRLGPDALDPGFTREDFIARLAGRTGAVKGALMNQSIVAGIGNIYSDEILFQAGVHPMARLDRLSEADLRAIFRAGRRVLAVAVRKDADLKRLPRGYLLRRRRPGGLCPRCRLEWTIQTVAGRTAYFCPACQQMR